MSVVLVSNAHASPAQQTARHFDQTPVLSKVTIASKRIRPLLKLFLVFHFFKIRCCSFPENIRFSDCPLSVPLLKNMASTSALPESSGHDSGSKTAAHVSNGHEAPPIDPEHLIKLTTSEGTEFSVPYKVVSQRFDCEQCLVVANYVDVNRSANARWSRTCLTVGAVLYARSTNRTDLY